MLFCMLQGAPGKRARSPLLNALPLLLPPPPAVGFIIVFRTNFGYQRYCEGRACL